jgi:hypothetical protein
VKDIMKKIQADNYYYSHIQSMGKKETFKDIENLIPNNYIRGYHVKNEPYKIINDSLFINTWIGVPLNFNFGKNIPFSCDIYNNYMMYEYIYNALGIKIENIEFYIPDIDYNKIDNDAKININEFINKNQNKKKILISNGNVLSGQSVNFDMNHIVKKLSNEYPEIIFILTDDSNRISSNNIFYTNDIIKINGCDLLEISYISTFCDFLIGRGSGPFCFTITKDNVKNKHFIGIGEKELEILWCDMMDKKLYINNYDLENIFDQINNYIKINI